MKRNVPDAVPGMNWGSVLTERQNKVNREKMRLNKRITQNCWWVILKRSRLEIKLRHRLTKQLLPQLWGKTLKERKTYSK